MTSRPRTVTRVAEPVPEAASGLEVSLDRVAHRFGDVPALADVSLTVPAHGRCGVVGPSGCGKSTLLGIVAGLLEPTEGQVSVGGGYRAAQRLEACALMPQKDLLLPWRRAVDNAALALQNRGMRRAAARSRVEPLFERFNLSGFELSWPHELSGGMRQRVAFLRTLVAGKDVLLLDEPFGGLDALTRADMQDWLRGVLIAEPRTVVLVTHDVEEALLLCDQVVVMSERPGTVLARFPVDLPASPSRAQAVADPEFVGLRRQVLDALGQGRRPS